MYRIFALVSVLALLVASCGSDAEPETFSTVEQTVCAPAIPTGLVVGPYTFIDSTNTEYDYYVYVPSSYDHCDVDAHPLVLAFHGGGQPLDGTNGFVNKPYMDDMRSRAETVGAVMIWIESGPSRHWNHGHSGNLVTRDHLTMVEEFVPTVQNLLEIDPDRIHAVGYSNGGMFALTLAAEMDDVFASVASVNGSSGSYHAWPLASCPLPYDCMGDWDALDTVWSGAVPTNSDSSVLMIRSGQDNTIPHDGGASFLLSRSAYFIPAVTPGAPGIVGETDYELWQISIGCTPQVTTIYLGVGSSYKCTDGSQTLRLDGVDNATHAWPTLTNGGYNASKKVAEFLWAHPK